MEDNIKNYISNGNIDMEKMINKYKGYIRTVISNEAKEYLSEEDIDEAISDVFINIWHNKNRMLESKNLKNYIVGISKNVTRNKIREKIKKYSEVELNEDIVSDTEDLELILNNNQIAEAIKEELNNLSEDEYKVFCNYYYLDKSTKDIAYELKMSEINIRVKLHRIRNKLKNNLSKKGIDISKYIGIAILVTLLILSFAGAKAIVKYFFKDASKGVKTAEDNGYVQEFDIKKNNNDVDIRIEKIIMDDYNLNIMFDIKLPNNINTSDVKKCDFPDLFITDENNNWIVTKFQSEKLTIKEAEEIRNMMNYPGLSLGNESSHIANYTDNSIKYSYTTNSSEFPKSKALKIQMDQIILEMNSGENITLDGYWTIDIDLPEEFYNRQQIIYNLKNVSDSRFVFEYFIVSKTGAKFMYTSSWINPDYNPNDDKETFEKKFNAWLDDPKWNHIDEYRGLYVENENGEKFYQSAKSDGDGYTDVAWNGNIESMSTLEITEYDLTDKLWVHLKYTKEYYGEDGEVIFELERSK